MIDWTHPEPPQMRTIASICRCSSPQMHADRAISAAQDRARYDVQQAQQQAAANAEALRKREAELASRTPKPDQYEVRDVVQVGENLVLKVRYPSCSTCAYEGDKVLVILNVAPIDAMRWRRIDPHFRDSAKVIPATEAPTPAARFPASAEGWSDALDYARKKAKR